MPRVGDEVQDDPLEALAVEADGREPGLDALTHRDPLAGHPPGHPVEASESVREIDPRFALRFALRFVRGSRAPEGEHFFHEHRTPFDRSPDLVELTLARGRTRQLELEQIRITENRRQHIVEIVGRRARHPPEGREPLAASPLAPQRRQLALEPVAFEIARHESGRGLGPLGEIPRRAGSEEGTVEADHGEHALGTGARNLERRGEAGPTGRRREARGGRHSAEAERATAAAGEARREQQGLLPTRGRALAR